MSGEFDLWGEDADRGEEGERFFRTWVWGGSRSGSLRGGVRGFSDVGVGKGVEVAVEADVGVFPDHDVVVDVVGAVAAVD